MHTALTPLAPIIALVMKDSMEMAIGVRILMSAKTMFTVAVFVYIAIIPLALIAAIVMKDSMEMATHARISMSAKIMFTVVVFMHTAITVLALMTVLASQATPEMDDIVMVRTRSTFKVSLLSCPQLSSCIIYVKQICPHYNLKYQAFSLSSLRYF